MKVDRSGSSLDTKMSDFGSDMVADLRKKGYVADEEIGTALYLAEDLKKPILIEGKAGVGKTEIAHVLARVRGMELIRLQCYEGLDSNSALYEWNYQKQILSLKIKEIRKDVNLELVDFYTEEYLLYRPISKALMSESPAVLLLDEIDRADEEFEALLLETLGEFQLTIPELGVISAKSNPFVILTSNRTRELSDALRRRCLYLWIDYPTYEKELEVIQLKVPKIDLKLASQAATFVQLLREESLSKTPGLSEAVDWTRALQSIGALELDDIILTNTMGCLLKDKLDIDRFRKGAFQSVLNKARDAKSL